jgi:hypothetical protein
MYYSTTEYTGTWIHNFSRHWRTATLMYMKLES